MIGAAGLAIGLALQGSLQNFASGVLLIVFRPFKVGHFIEAAGVSGVVEEIGIFSIRMKTGDNREIIVPNGAIYDGTITNNSARDTRRIDMVFAIGYVNFNVRPWVKSGDYWAVKFDYTEKLKLAFDDAGISIPYPQMDVHINKPE